MESVGQPLKAAREKKQMTVSDISSAIKAKMQIIEAIEHDNFSAMPAPIYARGFIKLYAECVGIDPTPLIKAYATYYMPGAVSPQISYLLQRPARIDPHGSSKKPTQIKAKIQLDAARIFFPLDLESFRVGEVKHSFAGIDKAKKLLNYQPSVNFDEGLKKTVEFLSK